MGCDSEGCQRYRVRLSRELVIGGVLMMGAAVWFGVTKRSLFEDASIHIGVSVLIAGCGLGLAVGGAYLCMQIKKDHENLVRQDASSRCPTYAIQTQPTGFNPPPYPQPTGFNPPPPYPPAGTAPSYPPSSFNPPPYPATGSINPALVPDNPPPYPVASFGAPMPPPSEDPPPYSQAYTYSNPVGDK